jgi:predicted exporter
MTRPPTIALLWLLVMAGGIWLSATHVSVRSELGDLLPEGTTATQRLLLTQVRSGLAGRVILLAITGGNPDALARTSKDFSGRLRASAHITLVENGEGLMPQERDAVFQSRYLLSPAVGPDAFSTESLRAALQQRIDDLRSPLSALVKQAIPADPTGEFVAILAAWSGEQRPAAHRGVWMSKDRSKALLLVQTKAAGFDADAQSALLEDMRQAFDSVSRESGALRLIMTGPGVFAVEAKETIENEAWRLSTAAAALVLLFLYASYRSLALVLLSLIPLTAGIVAGMLAVQGCFGFIHGITLGFGITLLGVVDDYPIHLFSHLSARGSASSVIEEIWPTMRLGVLTTAIGFAALLGAGFPALTQLGVFAVTGILTAALVTRWVLPQCVPSAFMPRPTVTGLQARLEGLTRMKPLMPAAILLACAALIWSHTPLWETELASLSPVSDANKALDRQLRDELGAPDVRELLVIEGQSEEDVLQYAEAVDGRLKLLQTRGVISGYELISHFLPSRRTQEERRSFLPERPVLTGRLQEALKGLPFTPGLFAPFVSDVESARSQPPLERKTYQHTVIGARIASLMFEREGKWTAVVPLRGVQDRTHLADAVAGWKLPAVTYVDLKAESNRLMTAYRDRTFLIVLGGLVVIGVVLAAGMRSVSLIWPILFPFAAALTVVVSHCDVLARGRPWTRLWTVFQSPGRKRRSTIENLVRVAGVQHDDGACLRGPRRVRDSGASRDRSHCGGRVVLLFVVCRSHGETE